MLRKLVLLTAIIAGAAFAEAAIDFTPTPREYVSEGIIYQSVSFKDDKRTVSMELPSHWGCHGSPGRIQFIPPGVNFAEGSVEAIDLATPHPLDEATTKAFAQQVVEGVPPGSQSVALVEQVVNPVLIGGNESCGVVVTYKTLGQTFRRSVILVNGPEHRLVLRFTAPEKQFDSLNQTFRRAVCTWEEK